MTDQSASPKPFQSLTELARAATANSTVIAIYRRLSEAIASSHLAGTSPRLQAIIRQSFIYRWLTKEPDPEVIVIDLRDTWTVGPIIGVLDRIITWIQPYWASSVANQTVEWSGRLLSTLANTWTGTRIVQLLEPPEPSDEVDEEDLNKRE